jgi:hypothetical protein
MLGNEMKFVFGVENKQTHAVVVPLKQVVMTFTDEQLGKLAMAKEFYDKKNELYREGRSASFLDDDDYKFIDATENYTRATKQVDEILEAVAVIIRKSLMAEFRNVAAAQKDFLPKVEFKLSDIRNDPIINAEAQA